MLHSYRFSNVYSFHGETEVSLLQDKRVPESFWWAEEPLGGRVGKVAAVIGPNASGKTSLLNALAFLHWFITGSFIGLKPDEPLPFLPHLLHENAPSMLEAEFASDLDGSVKTWRYRVVLTRKRVLSESLYQRRVGMVRVFERTWNEADNRYTLKDNGFGIAAIAKETIHTRQNASLIAIGTQHGLPIAKALANIVFRTNIVETGKELSDGAQIGRATDYFFDHPHYHEQLSGLLRAWDLGLSEVQLREFTAPATDPQATAKPIRVALGVHTGKDAKQYLLPLSRESRGTQAAFVLLAKLLPVLEDGGLAVIDEFESDLHPHMLAPILDLFANPTTNPHNAQLLFTSHSMEVLNLLPKSQVILVEKDEFNESKAWRLDEVKGIRSDDNFYAKYMSGAYGAVPRL